MSDSETSDSFLRSIAPILAVLGVGFYAYLTYVYQRYYTALDVTPSDVGFTYATTLNRSTGLILAGLAAFVGLFILRNLLGALLVSFIEPGELIAVIMLAVISWLVLPFVLYPVTEPRPRSGYCGQTSEGWASRRTRPRVWSYDHGLSGGLGRR
jgi:hypothetical protein